MPYKICPYCYQTSYSASTSQVWFCPVCGRELTSEALASDRRILRQPVRPSFHRSSCSVLIDIKQAK